MDRKTKIKNQIEKEMKNQIFPEKELPNNFEDSLHMRLIEAENSRSKKAKASFFAFLKPAVLPLSFAIVFIAGLYAGRSVDNKKLKTDTSAQKVKYHNDSLITSTTVVNRGEPVTIKLVYNSKVNIKNVNFTIKLHNGVKFVSKNEEIASAELLSWDGELKKGRNEIPFVVETEMIGEWFVDAVAEFEGGNHKHKIKIITNEKNIKAVKMEEKNV